MKGERRTALAPLLNLRKEKSQRDLLKEAKEKEEKREREREKQEAKHGKRGRGATISYASSASSSPNLTASPSALSLSTSGLSSSATLSSSSSSASSPTTPTRGVPGDVSKLSLEFPYLDDDDAGIRARSHSTSTTKYAPFRPLTLVHANTFPA
jgi:hypothetical protein